MRKMKVAVIGGGPSGLTAAKACLEANLVPTVFERDLSLGGLWKTGSGGRVWSSLKTNLSKHTCCFSDFRWPEDVPDFPSAGQVRQYLEDYAVRFDLVRHVRFGLSVIAVTPTHPEGDVGDCTTPRWSVTFAPTKHEPSAEVGEPSPDCGATCDGESDVVQRTEIFDKCIIASGIFSEPNFPPASKVAGITAALEQGWVTHGAAYKNPGSYEGKTALVVGCAFSGAEIASELSGVTTRCLAATGKPSIYLPRNVAMDTSGHQAHTPASPIKTDTHGTTGASGIVSETGPGETSIAGRSHSCGGRDPPDSSDNTHRSDRERDVGEGHKSSSATCNAKLPLDLVLYSLKSSAEGKKSTASASEKRERARKFLVALAGKDPGDVHHALRLPDSGGDDYDPEASPVLVSVSDDFLNKVQDGSIEVRSRLVALDLTERTARFSDGTCDRVDDVILCTGLRPSLNFLSDKVLKGLEYDKDDLIQPLILHLQTWNPRVPDLGFVGVYRGPYFGSMELQARWLTRMWSGEVPPPAEAVSDVAMEEARSLRNCKPRPQFPTDYVDFMESVAVVAGLLSSKQQTQPGEGSEGRRAEGTAIGADNVSTVAPSSDGTGDAAGPPEDRVGTTAIKVGDSSPDTSNADRGATGGDDTARAMRRALKRLILAGGTPGQLDREKDRADNEKAKAEEEKAMSLLHRWVWTGPLLPCHYHVRPFLSMQGGYSRAKSTRESPAGEPSSVAVRANLCDSVEDRLDTLYQAIAEIQHVNAKFEKAKRTHS